MVTKIATKIPVQLRALVRAEVNAALRDIFFDPEYDLPLRKSFIRKLERSRRELAQGRTIPLEEVKRRLGLK